MLEIRNYHKYYDNYHVLSCPELILEQGVYYFAGINGSGKTSLFKSIAGLTDFEGECLIDGTSTRKKPVEYRELVTYCPAEPAFPGFLTLRDLVSFTGSARNADDAEIDKLINLLKVNDFYRQATGTFSSGMLKKAGLLLAFLGKPSVIILDEPFTTIDQETRKILFRLIRDFSSV